MPGFDGSGNYTRNYQWAEREASGVGIVSSEHDIEDNEFATAFNNTFCRDGQAAATGNWNLGGHRIGSLGAAVNDDEAVTRGQLTGSGPAGTPPLQKSLSLSGADTNGRVNFTSATGVQGLGWFGTDLSFLTRPDVANQSSNRWVFNNAYAGGGTDVISIDERGYMNMNGGISWNLSIDGSGIFRTPAAGYGAYHTMNNAYWALWGMDAVTASSWNSTVMREVITAKPNGGNAFFELHKNGASGKFAGIYGFNGTEARWLMEIGDGTAESGTAYVGSNFSLYAYDNAGLNADLRMSINRSTGDALFSGAVSGNGIFANGAGTGSLYLRPNGAASTSEQVYVDSTGNLIIGTTSAAVGGGYLGFGMRERNGKSGAYGTDWFNFGWASAAPTTFDIYVNDTAYTVSMTAVCDYRIKQEVKPLESSWEAVKALRPVSYQFANWGVRGDGRPMVEADGKTRWGFIAHEAGTVLDTMATGEKDASNRLQTIDLMPIVAALTNALQEAMVRIEALEARLA